MFYYTPFILYYKNKMWHMTDIVFQNISDIHTDLENNWVNETKINEYTKQLKTINKTLISWVFDYEKSLIEWTIRELQSLRKEIKVAA